MIFDLLQHVMPEQVFILETVFPEREVIAVYFSEEEADKNCKELEAQGEQVCVRQYETEDDL